MLFLLDGIFEFNAKSCTVEGEPGGLLVTTGVSIPVFHHSSMANRNT